jgi:drug/metabolite transporter (DMT)-like permease
MPDAVVTMALASPFIRSGHSPIAGMALAATAFALLTAVDTIFKLMAEGHPAYQILLVNGCFAVLPIITWALLTGGLGRLHTERPYLHLLRGSVSVVSAFCAIYAYSRLPLVDFYAIVFSGPLIVTALSAFWLNEKVDSARWLAVMVGFLGVVLVTHPFKNSGSGHNLEMMAGRLAALLSVFCYSLSVIMIRRMRLGESNLAFAFYGYVASITISGTLLLISGGPPMLPADIAHLGLCGFLAGFSSICLMTAYHRSPVSLVAPFQYTQIFWGALAGWLLWAHLPDKHLVAGAFIVAGSGLFVIYREMRASEGKKTLFSVLRLADRDDRIEPAKGE